MTGYKIPIFQRGSLLTQEMLDAMKQYTTKVTIGQYEGYSDGIISGMNIQVSDGVITIGTGIIKYKDALLVMPECVTLPITESDQLQLVKLRVSDKEIGAEFETIEMNVVVEESTEKKQNEIEICRMYVQCGARLRSQYRNFQDMSTTYDTIQIIDADWSAYKTKGIHPQILEQFAREARESQTKEPLDLCFIQQILGMQGNACPREVIEFYLSEKLDVKQIEYTNQQLYQGLYQVLQRLKNGSFIKPKARETRRMIVD